MKRFLLMFLMLFSFTLLATACTTEGDPIVDEPGIEEEEPKEEEPKEEEPELDLTIIRIPKGELVKGEYALIELEIEEGFDIIGIQIESNYAYDTPVNFRNFKFDGVEVNFDVELSTPYLYWQETKIDGRLAMLHLVNNREGDIGLHTMHTTNKGKPDEHTETDHGIGFDIRGLKTISFEFTITTNAINGFENLVIKLSPEDVEDVVL